MRKARIVLGAIFLVVAIAWGACAAYGFMVSSTAVNTVEPIYTDSIEDPNAGVQNAVADNSTNTIALITKMGNFENTILTLFGFASASFALTFLGLSIFNFAASGDGYVKATPTPQPIYPTGVYQAVPSGNTGVYPVVTANTGVYQAVPSTTGVYPIVQVVPQEQAPVQEPVQEAKKPTKKKKAKSVKKNTAPVQEEEAQGVEAVQDTEVEPAKEAEPQTKNEPTQEADAEPVDAENKKE